MLLKHYHYKQSFNWRVYGAAEKRADEYWKKRKQMQAIGDSMAISSEKESKEHGPQIIGRR
jgi:uncharacterized damage-inducible protein DinB